MRFADLQSHSTAAHQVKREEGVFPLKTPDQVKRPLSHMDIVYCRLIAKDTYHPMQFRLHDTLLASCNLHERAGFIQTYPPI